VYRDTTLTSTDLVRQLWLDNYFYGGVYSLQYKNKGTQITFGGGLNRYDGRHYGKLVWGEVGVPVDHKYYDLDAWKTDVNFYGKWQQQLFGNWQSFVDLQYRRVRYDISGFEDNPTLFTSNNYNFFNPKAGLTYSKNNWTAYGSVALANKEPNRDDFEADREHQPKYESLTDYELGLEHRSSKSSWGANVYYMRYRNQLVLTGELNSVGAYTRTNIDRSYRLGIELQGSTRPLPWMQLSGNITLSENKVFDFKEYVDDYDNGGQKLNQFRKTDISFSPSLIAGATASVIPFKQAEISLIGKYVGRQYLDNTGNRDRSLDAFYVQDLRLRYTLKERLLRQVDFIVQLNNIFNRKYEPNGYTYSYIYNQQLTTENYVYPMAGINFMAGVNIRL
jgi:iron complex outermembrane receptor protein